MIKGVNRQMIEVTQTDSPFYERALFVVKPEYAGESYEALHREAIQVMERLGAPSAFRRRNKALFWGLRLGAAALAGAGIALLAVALLPVGLQYASARKTGRTDIKKKPSSYG